MMTHPSDTIDTMVSEQSHAAILRKAALTAVNDARSAWKTAYASPTEDSVRGAYRACVLAARALRKAAQFAPDEASEMLQEAVRIEATAAGLKGRLVRIVESQS